MSLDLASGLTMSQQQLTVNESVVVDVVAPSELVGLGREQEIQKWHPILNIIDEAYNIPMQCTS